MRVLAALLVTAAGFIGSLVIIQELAPRESRPRPAVADESRTWEDARAVIADLRRIASQSCSFLAANGGQAPGEFVQRFRASAEGYRDIFLAAAASGEERPEDVPSTAPSLAELHQLICPDAMPAAVAAPAETPAAPPPEDMDFEGLYGAHVLTPEQLDAAAFLAGWPMEDGWWPQMRQIVYCESGRNIFAYNPNDPNGGSYGLAQLNGRQHFDRAGENFEYRFDPIVNLRTALWLRTARGHFGGAGGWKICAELYGIQ